MLNRCLGKAAFLVIPLAFLCLAPASPAQSLSISPASMRLDTHVDDPGQGIFIVTNNGSTSVDMGPIYFESGNYFFVTYTDCSTLASGAQCAIHVEFAPGNDCLVSLTQYDTLDVGHTGGFLYADVTGHQDSCY